MTQTGATLKTSSQCPRRAAPLESGCDPFPPPQATAARPDVQNSIRAPKPYPGHGPGLLEALNLPEQAVSYDLVSPASSQLGARWGSTLGHPSAAMDLKPG